MDIASPLVTSTAKVFPEEHFRLKNKVSTASGQTVIVVYTSGPDTYGITKMDGDKDTDTPLYNIGHINIKVNSRNFEQPGRPVSSAQGYDHTFSALLFAAIIGGEDCETNSGEKLNFFLHKVAHGIHELEISHLFPFCCKRGTTPTTDVKATSSGPASRPASVAARSPSVTAR